MQNENLSKHKIFKLAATAFISAAMFSISAFPALAYTFPPTIETENINFHSIDTVHLDLISSDNASSLTSSYKLESELYELLNGVDFSKSDWYCVNENGIVSEYTLNTVDPNTIPCNHDYLAVRLSHHTKNNGESCYVDYYSAKQCSKHDHIVEIDHIAKTIFNKCPH